MANTEEAPCPRCGHALTLRIGEYECPNCGYFALANSVTPAAGAAPAPVRGTGTPPGIQQPPRERVFTGVMPDLRQQRLAFHKLVFTAAACVLLAVGNCLALSEPSTPGHEYAAMAVAGITAGLLAGLLLFANWRSFQLFCSVAVLAGTVFYAMAVYAAWADSSALLKAKLCTDGVLLLWLALLFWRSSRAAE